MIQFDSVGKWTTLPLNDKIAKTFYLAALKFFNKIIVFGGA